MKTIKMITVAASLFTMTLFSACFGQYNDKKETKKDNQNNTNGQGFAVVELFTSEGCSSCPPADELVAKVQQENAGKPVYMLAYHVDYWDFQGWKDVFANPGFTKRQYQYASWLKTETVYTPQIVVNGSREFVGSQEESLNEAVTAGLQSSPSASLTINGRQDHDKIVLQYQAKGALKNASLQLALVQKVAQTIVKRGENAGHLLSHVQIVRQIQSQSINMNGNGEAEIRLPNGFDLKDWEVIGFLQNKENGEILAVAKPDLKENI